MTVMRHCKFSHLIIDNVSPPEHHPFQDTEVGVAWLGTLCQTDSTSQSGSTVSGTGVSSSTRTEWSLTSHEIGHNFGAIHDVSRFPAFPGSR
jgi:hypothetical protein